MPEITDDFARAWIEFEDPDDSNQRIRADLTWLTSRWQCIYGQGCQSIDAQIPHGGCCTFGAHLADATDEQRVSGFVAQLTHDDWELKPEGDDPATAKNPTWESSTLVAEVSEADWIQTDSDGERKTLVTAGACVFLNGPDFAAGAGCALHVLANRLGESHVRTKPDVCWQLPIRRDFETSERADGVETTIVIITEYVRGMWGAGGHDLDWYCSSNTEAHTAAEPVYKHSQTELVELVGGAAYLDLVRHCEAHEAARQQLAIVQITQSALGVHPADHAG